MKCALCKERDADKKNTHYLSDGIIRKCLNIGGTNERERGFYFDISNGNPFVEFNFQRIDEVNLEKALGRAPTAEELENARQIPFSVDYMFCNVCEKSFRVFESDFSTHILPKFRNSELAESDYLTFEDLRLIRMFFYIQIWRNSICEETFNLSPKAQEELRQIILNPKTEKINHFPLSITYLETLGGDMAFTENYVGSTSDKNPYIIFMNDFIVQFFESRESVKFEEFYGLNNEVNYMDYVNIEEDSFIVNIFHNEDRKQLLSDIIRAEKVKQTIDSLESIFDLMWQRLFYGFPPTKVKKEYIGGLVGDDNFSVLKYSKKQIFEYTKSFICDRIRK